MNKKLAIIPYKIISNGNPYQFLDIHHTLFLTANFHAVKNFLYKGGAYRHSGKINGSGFCFVVLGGSLFLALYGLRHLLISFIRFECDPLQYYGISPQRVLFCPNCCYLITHKCLKTDFFKPTKTLTMNSTLKTFLIVVVAVLAAEMVSKKLLPKLGL